MRGDDRHPDAMFSYVAPEQRVPADHPLRAIRGMVDTALRELSPEFARLYPKTGRPSIPPEKLLRALLLQMLYSVRSERQLMEAGASGPRPAGHGRPCMCASPSRCHTPVDFSMAWTPVTIPGGRHVL
jgi:hypothetical protein